MLNGTLITLIQRMFTDFFISVNPSNLRYPCSTNIMER